MLRRSDCKSAPEVYCKPEDGRDRAVSDDQINPLAPTVELAPPPVVGPQMVASSTTTPLFIPPRRLALCGGGVRCIAHVGVFKGLQEANLLHCVKEVIGISAGALFALMYCCGYSLDQIEQLALRFDFTVLRNIDPETAFDFPMTLGLDSGEGLDRLLSSLLTRKGMKEDITFAEMATLQPIHLRCFATEIQTARVKEFSFAKTPNMSVKFAVRASMSLPILYTPMKDPVTGSLLMDGGILHNLPLAFLPQEEIAETLAVLFTLKGGDDVSESDVDILKFFKYIYDSITVMRNKYYLERFPKQILCVPVKEVSVTDFSPSLEMRKQLIQLALDSARRFLRTAGSKPIRRYSVS